MDDRLQTLFNMQKSFDEQVIKTRGLDSVTPEEWVQKEMLAIFSELAEVLEEVNFKWWKNAKPVDWDKVKGELVDVFHFFMSTCMKVDMNADELFRRYMLKNKENFDRQNGVSEKKGYALSEAATEGKVNG